MRPVPALLGAGLPASLLPAPGALHAQDPGQALALVQQIRLADGARGSSRSAPAWRSSSPWTWATS